MELSNTECRVHTFHSSNAVKGSTMKIIIFTFLLVSLAVQASDYSSMNPGPEKRFYESHGASVLRKQYPFFDGMPPGIPDNDVRRTDEWEANRYDIIKRNDKGECELLPMEKIVKNRLEARPYLRMMGPSLFRTTLGQLSKQCDGVFIGEIIDVGRLDDKDRAEIARGIALPVEITFQIKTNLFGSLSKESVTIPMLWMEYKESLPETGLRALVFYGQGYKIGLWDVAASKFEWIKPPPDPKSPPRMLFEDYSTSLRILKTPAIEKTYIETVNGYLQIFRKEKRSPIKYYAFLKPLVKSPIWRIRQDAREDMLRLLRYDGPEMFDLKIALDDPELMDFFKDYIRYIVFPARENPMTEK